MMTVRTNNTMATGPSQELELSLLPEEGRARGERVASVSYDRAVKIWAAGPLGAGTRGDALMGDA